MRRAITSRYPNMTLRTWMSLSLGLLASGHVLAADPSLTPQQLIDEVRAQQASASTQAATSAPLLAPVPSIADLSMPTMRPTHRAPTLEDKARLEAQLKDINSALKIKQVTERSVQRASDAIAARGQMLFTFSPGGIYEVETATFHETALQLQPGETLSGQGLPTAGDTARWTIAATKSGSTPERIRHLDRETLGCGS